MSDHGTTMALIPARGGSRGIPGKNLRPLAGIPLLAYSIAAAKLSRLIDRVVVTTDSEEIAAVARKFGAEIPFLRPPEYARNDSPDLEFVNHALDWFAQREGDVPETIVHLRPTTPLRDPTIVDEAITRFVGHATATSLRSGHPAPESPFKWFLRDNQGFFQPLAPAGTTDGANQPRQAFPETFIPDGYVDVLRTAFIRKSGQLHGDRMLGFVSPPCVEVDVPEDLDYLEWWSRKSPSPLRAYFSRKPRTKKKP